MKMKVAGEVKEALSPGANFTNVFMRSFYTCRSQKRKKTYDLAVFFALLGSTRIKDVHKTLMKLTPGASVGSGLSEVPSAASSLS